MPVSAVETDAPRSVHYAVGHPACSGRIVTPEESIAVDRWMYGPDAPPDPQFDPVKPAREVVLRWAAHHGLLLYKGRPGDKHRPARWRGWTVTCPNSPRPNLRSRARQFLAWPKSLRGLDVSNEASQTAG